MNQLQRTKSYIEIDKDERKICINLGDEIDGKWNLELQAPSANISFIVKSLEIEALEGFIKLKTNEDKGILLNTSEEEFYKFKEKYKGLMELNNASGA